MPHLVFSFFFFFNDTATTEIYTLSLHDALPICIESDRRGNHDRDESSTFGVPSNYPTSSERRKARARAIRSEEHTSELQSRSDLVCRLLLEKKKKKKHIMYDQQHIYTDDSW